MIKAENLARSPNILFLTVDCFRGDRLNPDCPSKVATPQLDQLIGQESIWFTHAFANGPNTLAAFPALMTSSYSTMYGGSSFVSDERTPIAEILARAGYHTIGISSNPYLTPEFGYDRGFDIFRDTAQRSKSRANKVKLVNRFIKRDSALWNLLRKLARRTEFKSKKGLFPSAEKLNEDIFFELQRRDRSKPFFLWSHYMDLHYPFNPNILDFENLSSPAQGEIGDLLGRLMTDSMSLTPAQQELVIEIYDKSLEYVDAQVGNLIEFLKNEELWDDTIVVIAGDHGEELFEYGRYGHGDSNGKNSFCDALLHIPLIIKLPYSESAGMRIDKMVCQLDIPAFMCEVAEQPIPQNWLGKSLLPLLKNNGVSEHHDEIITQIGRRHKFELSCRTPEWKLVFDGLEDVKRLYKLRPIANEEADVAGEYPAVFAKLDGVIKNHFNKHSNAYSARRIAGVEIDDEMKQQLRGLGYLE